MRVALCQIDTTVGDLRGNRDRMLAAYRRAAGFGVDLVVFPELAITGYPPRDLLEQPAFLEAAREEADAATRAAGETGLLFGLPLPNGSGLGKPLLNGARLAANGAVVAEIAKKLLPTYDVFDEHRHFEPDGTLARPVDFRGERLGIHVCEDAWNEEGFWDRRLYPRDPVAELAAAGATLLVNLSASPFHGEKGVMRRSMFRSHVRAHSLPFLYTNLVGGNDELVFDGEAFAFSADGTLVACGEPFTEEIVLVEVEDGAVRALGNARVDGDGEPGPARHAEPLPILEALHRALVLGLSDYARKCGFDSALIGLSGGIDSAVTAALAVDALGADRVWGVGLPSRYSSEGSVTDARDLAANLGIRFDVLPIEPLYGAALEVLEPLFRGTDFGVAEENLQARARGNLLMGLSNKFGHLLLTTGNKSEMATGYCTLYGDMAGGLAVISDVPKTQVYELARHLNREGERIPENTLVKPPSAELRPNQRDEDSLPPYPILDDLLERHLEDREGRESLIAAGHDPVVVDRVLSLVARAEYKRRQAPPGLRVSPKAFGSGRRVPIATPWPRR